MVRTRSMAHQPEPSETSTKETGYKHDTQLDPVEEPPRKQAKGSREHKRKMEISSPAMKEETETTGVKQEEGATTRNQGQSSKHPLLPHCLELGIIYFYFRPRVGQQAPQGVDDMARSYIVLRPIENFDEPLSDDGKSRVCIIPKKILPTTGRERWIGFVGKGNEPYSKITQEDLSARGYDTKTRGERQIPAAMLIGAGVYALSKGGRGNNLVYILSQPKELGETQIDMGLKPRGYFTISTRNPEYPAPKGVAFPEGPKYPQDIMDDFRSLRWIPTEPRHLDYDMTQFLLIGHTSGLDQAFTGRQRRRKKVLEVKEEPVEGEEDILEDLGEEEIAELMAGLEKYVGKLPKVEISY